jgi:P-type E1-E2 ATPase
MLIDSGHPLGRLLAVPALVAAGLLTVLASLVWVLGMSGSALLWTYAVVAGLMPLTVWAVQDAAGRMVGGSLFTIPVVIATIAAGQHELGVAINVLACLGRGLELLVWRRARSALSVVARYDADRRLETGDRVRIATGASVPVDGRLLADAVLDESSLSGEPTPLLRHSGEQVRSGVINVGEPVEVIATAPERDGTWAAMARLARRAISDGAGPGRRANRAALVLLPLGFVAAVVVWHATGDLSRAFGVWVVITPGPFLLAGPLALAAGMTRAARMGVVVGDAGVLAALGRTRIGVIDSTGVVTAGTLSVTEIVAAPAWLTDTVLAVAASVQRFRPHPLAGAVMRAAEQAGLRASLPSGKVTIGDERPNATADWVRVAIARAELDGASTAWVSIDGQPIGALLVRDELRPEAADSLRRLRASGLRRLVLVTHGNVNNPEDMGLLLGVDELWTGCETADKIERVREERRHGRTLMIGDDPAVGAADVSVVLSGRGTCAADVIITDGRVARLANAVRTARRSRRIGAFATSAGLTLMLAGMGASVLGWLAPVLAVLTRVGVDVLVMGLALGALAQSRPDTGSVVAEHDRLRPARLAVREAADRLSTGLTTQALQSVLRAYHLISDQVVPMQPTRDIERQVRRLGAHLTAANTQLDDLRATLYGLNAVLTELYRTATE